MVKPHVLEYGMHIISIQKLSCDSNMNDICLKTFIPHSGTYHFTRTSVVEGCIWRGMLSLRDLQNRSDKVVFTGDVDCSTQVPEYGMPTIPFRRV